MIIITDISAMLIAIDAWRPHGSSRIKVLK